MLENVAVHAHTRVPDFADDSRTENTRAAYPLAHIGNFEPSSRGVHPDTVIFLTCDAFGVMPPVSRLSVEQAMYHFLSGYTALVAGTEAGITEPTATFSTCFAAPFLPLRPARYAELLADRLRARRRSLAGQHWLDRRSQRRGRSAHSAGAHAGHVPRDP